MLHFWRPPTEAGAVRRHDGMSSGAWLASRDGGTRYHAGLDFVAAPGEPVYAPAQGVVTRLGRAYSDPAKAGYKLIEIRTAGCWLTRIMYIAPAVRAHACVAAGDLIGHAQNIAAAYPADDGTLPMTNHVHLDVRLARSRVLVGGIEPAERVFVDPNTLMGWCTS